MRSHGPSILLPCWSFVTDDEIPESMIPTPVLSQFSPIGLWNCILVLKDMLKDPEMVMTLG